MINHTSPTKLWTSKVWARREATAIEDYNGTHTIVTALQDLLPRLDKAGARDITHGWGLAPMNAWNSYALRYHVRATVDADYMRKYSQRQEVLDQLAKGKKTFKLYFTLYKPFGYKNFKFIGQWGSVLPRDVK